MLHCKFFQLMLHGKCELLQPLCSRSNSFLRFADFSHRYFLFEWNEITVGCRRWTRFLLHTWFSATCWLRSDTFWWCYCVPFVFFQIVLLFNVLIVNLMWYMCIFRIQCIKRKIKLVGRHSFTVPNLQHPTSQWQLERWQKRRSSNPRIRSASNLPVVGNLG